MSAQLARSLTTDYQSHLINAALIVHLNFQVSEYATYRALANVLGQQFSGHVFFPLAAYKLVALPRYVTPYWYITLGFCLRVALVLPVGASGQDNGKCLWE
jgi:hypothetical protein